MTSTSRTWNVKPNRFPFGTSVEILGTVNADTREEACKKARDHYGADVVVQLAHSPNSFEHSRIGRPGHFDSRPRSGGLLSVPIARRDMTSDEAQMARAAACCRLISGSKDRGTIRLLHARSLSANRTITDVEAQRLRACILEFRAELKPEIVALAGGAP
jgi:hypothetical protein